VETVREMKQNAIELSARQAYIRLKKKYTEQQKMLKQLTAEEKFEFKDSFRNLGGGRKKKYTPAKMKNKIIEYFAKMKAMSRPPTKSGLMVHLKMHRDQFYQYATYPEFKDIMEQTATMIENWYEEALILNKYNASGIQFALKNRFGWTDSTTLKLEQNNSEDNLVRKIESLAPELAGFFKAMSDKMSAEVDIPKQIMIEAEFTDEDFELRGNE
jgi:hypothetical protein